MTAAGLRKAIERYPWLRRLGNPLSHAELVESRCPVTRIPLGMGAAMGGRPYVPLRLLLANEWGRPDIGGYAGTPIQ